MMLAIYLKAISTLLLQKKHFLQGLQCCSPNILDCLLVQRLIVMFVLQTDPLILRLLIFSLFYLVEVNSSFYNFTAVRLSPPVGVSQAVYTTAIFLLIELFLF